MILEPKLEGAYKKYSNNFGYVDKEDRNTPQAFSHFTYQYTNGKMIVVDIQGVKDYYTDPQIHSNIPESAPPIWGQGDMGDTGVYKFFESHRCNALCKFFGLNAVPGGMHKHAQSGTRVGAAGGHMHSSGSGLHLTPSLGYAPMALTTNVSYPTSSFGSSPYGSFSSNPVAEYGHLDRRPSYTGSLGYTSYPSYSSWGAEMIVC